MWYLPIFPGKSYPMKQRKRFTRKDWKLFLPAFQLFTGIGGW